MLAKKYEYENRLCVLENYEEKRRSRRRYFLKQKLCGLSLVAISLFCFFVERDITISLVAVPLGLYLFFTKTRAMLF